MPKCGTDAKDFHEMRLVLDAAYRNSYHALLLIKLHQDYVHKLEEITATDKPNEIVFGMRAKNDSDLLKLAAEARKDGAAKIRAKYQDGAVSVEDAARTAPPVPGNFYFDATGAKLKCLEIRDGVVVWLQLETQIGGLTVDAVVLQQLNSVRHVYEITDGEEKARLERRYDQVKSQIQIPSK
jgi:hypothetical protein